MIINFEPSQLSQTEVKALLAFLSTFLPDSQITVTASTTQPSPTSQTPGPSLVVPATQTEPASTTSRRGRRTNAQIAADEAAKQVQAQTPATLQSEPSPAPESTQPTQSINGALKSISADELRTLLNGFIQKHSMEEAIEKLRSFGCNRVTEALALEPAKLDELAASLNG